MRIRKHKIIAAILLLFYSFGIVFADAEGILFEDIDNAAYEIIEENNSNEILNEENNDNHQEAEFAAENEKEPDNTVSEINEDKTEDAYEEVNHDIEINADNAENNENFKDGDDAFKESEASADKEDMINVMSISAGADEYAVGVSDLTAGYNSVSTVAVGGYVTSQSGVKTFVNDYITHTVNVEKAGIYKVTLNIFASNRKFSLENKTNSTQIDAVSIRSGSRNEGAPYEMGTIKLNAGNNELVFTQTDGTTSSHYGFIYSITYSFESEIQEGGGEEDFEKVTYTSTDLKDSYHNLSPYGVGGYHATLHWITMRSQDYVEFTVNVPITGYYNIDMNVYTYANNYAYTVECNAAGSKIETNIGAKGTNPNEGADTNVGIIKLFAGENTVRFTQISGTMSAHYSLIYSITFTLEEEWDGLVEPSYEYTIIARDDLVNQVFGEGFYRPDGNMTLPGTSGKDGSTIISTGGWIRDKVTVDFDGYYAVSVTNSLLSRVNIINETTDSSIMGIPLIISQSGTFETILVGYLYLHSGENIIRTEGEAAAVSIRKIDLLYVGDTIPENAGDSDDEGPAYSLAIDSPDATQNTAYRLKKRIFSEGGYADFSVGTITPGYYDIIIKSKGEGSVSINIDGIQAVNETISAPVIKQTIIENILINSTNPELRFILENGTFELSSVTLKQKDMTSMKIDGIDKHAFAYMPGGKGVAWDKKNGAAITLNATYGFVTLSTGDWVRYQFDVKKTGKYRILAGIGCSGGTNTLTLDHVEQQKTTGYIEVSGNSPFISTKYELAEMELEEGQNTFEFTVPLNGDSITIYSLSIEYISPDIDLGVCYSGDYVLTADSTTPRGTDKIIMYFDNYVADEGIKSAITIEGIGYDYEIEDNKVILYLLDSLDYNTAYQIDIGNVKSKSGGTCASRIVHFNTGSREKDHGQAELSVLEYNNEYERIRISGVVYSSASKPISGRNVRMYIDNSQICEALTGRNGEYLIDFTLDKNLYRKGNYTVKIETDYASAIQKELVYYSIEDEQEICRIISGANDIEELEGYLNLYAQYCSIAYSADKLLAGDHKNYFLNRLLGKTYTSFDAFCDSYYSNLYYTILVFAQNESEVNKILADKSKCEAVDLDYDKICLIEANKESLYADIYALEENQDVNAFFIELRAVIENNLKKESGKENVELNTKNISAAYGQGMTYTLGFVSTVTDVLKAEFYFDCSNKKFTDVYKLNIDSKYTYSAENKNGILKIVINSDGSAYELSEFGTITFTASETGSHTMKQYGNIVYGYEGYPVQFDINENTSAINISKATTVSGGGSDKSSGSPVSSAPSPAVTAPITTQNNKFNDLGGSEWAQDSIYGLLELGVVSMDESRNFRPSDNITREEFVKMIVTAMKYDLNNYDVSFNDLDTQHWAYSYVAAAVNNGLIYGMDENNFGIGKSITREDMAVIIYRVLSKGGYSWPALNGEIFADMDCIGEYAKEAVMNIKNISLISGMGDNTFAPKANATRAQAAKIIYDMIKIVEK